MVFSSDDSNLSPLYETISQAQRMPEVPRQLLLLLQFPSLASPCNILTRIVNLHNKPNLLYKAHIKICTNNFHTENKNISSTVLLFLRKKPHLLNTSCCCLLTQQFVYNKKIKALLTQHFFYLVGNNGLEPLTFSTSRRHSPS